MPPPTMTSHHVALIEKLTQAIIDSPIRLMSENEIAQDTQLTEGEFMARAKSFIKDPESGIPGGDEAKKLTLAILAKQHRRRLPHEAAMKLMKPLLPPEPTAAMPASPAAKKRKVAALKKAIAKKAPVKSPAKKAPTKAIKKAK